MILKCIQLCLLFVLASCARSQIDLYNSSFKNTNFLRTGKFSKVKVNEYIPPDNPDVEQLPMRAFTLNAPSYKFSSYLQDAIEQELGEARLIDPKSEISISTKLLENKLSSMGSGRLHIKAQFIVQRNEVKLYDEILVVDYHWESAFSGAEAYGLGRRAIIRAYQALVNKFLVDPKFQQVLRN